MSAGGSAGHFDGAMSDSQTVGKGFNKDDVGEASSETIAEGASAGSQALSGLDGGAGAMKGIASIGGMVAMHQVY